MSCLTDPAGADPSERKGSTIMTKDHRGVGGVDSHKDTVHVAVISATGEPLADQEFPTTRAGYRRAVAWLIEHGPLQSVGIEGTSSYGVGISTAVVLGGIDTVQLLDSDFRGNVGINLTGSAHSDVEVRDGIFDRAVTISTGGGDDYVAFDTDTEVSSIYSVFDGYVRINLGAGNDIFAAGSNPAVDTVGNDFNSYVDVNGGTGYDEAYFMHWQYNNGFNGPLPWTYSVEEYY